MPGAKRVFVDTNVLLYAVDSSNPIRQARAAEWLQHLWTTGQGAISWQVLHQFYVNAVRKFAVPAVEVRFVVDSLLPWNPIDSSPALIHRAWHWSDTAQLSHSAFLILAAAELAGCNVLLSEDFQTGRRFDEIQVVNPFTTAPPPPRVTVSP